MMMPLGAERGRHWYEAGGPVLLGAAGLTRVCLPCRG